MTEHQDQSCNVQVKKNTNKVQIQIKDLDHLDYFYDTYGPFWSMAV